MSGTCVQELSEALVGSGAEPHTPVMLDEVLEWLGIRPEGTYIDATLGAGGHSAAIAAEADLRQVDQPGPGRTGVSSWQRSG